MKIRKQVYVMCLNGHWFPGETCPIDGYKDELVELVSQTVKKLEGHSEELTLKNLIKRGKINERALKRLMIVEADDEVLLLQRYFVPEWNNS